MFYEIYAFVTMLIIICLVVLRKSEKKQFINFLQIVLLSLLVYWKVDLITSIIVLSVNLMTVLKLINFKTDYHDELSSKIFYLPKLKIFLLCLIIILLIFISFNLDQNIFLRKMNLMFNIETLIALVALLFTMLTIKKEEK
jgi:hypothetical protein